MVAYTIREVMLMMHVIQECYDHEEVSPGVWSFRSGMKRTTLPSLRACFLSLNVVSQTKQAEWPGKDSLTHFARSSVSAQRSGG